MNYLKTLFLLSLVAFESNAQQLQRLDPDPYFWQMANSISVSVDDCSREGIYTGHLRAISANPADAYLYGGSPWIGQYEWEGWARLYDITTSTTVASVSIPGSYLPVGTPIRGENPTDLYTDLSSVQSGSAGVFEVNPISNELVFHFDNITFIDGHSYEVEMRIENVWRWNGSVLGRNVIMNEWTNVMTVSGHSAHTPNAWNHFNVDQNYYGLANGMLAGNNGNGHGYFIGTDNRIYNCLGSFNSWNVYPLDNNFYGAATGTVEVNQGNGHVFFVGTDNRIFNAFWTGSAWAIAPLVSNFYGVAPGALAINQGNGNVYFIGTDNRIYNAFWNGSTWNIAPLVSNFYGAAPGAVAVNQGNGNVYFIGTDNRVYNAFWYNNQWNIAPLVSNFYSAATGAITVNSNNGEVYFVGQDNRMYQGVWANSQWNIWPVVSTFYNVAQGAITVNSGSGNVFFIGTDNKVYNACWYNNQWNMWALGNYYAQPGSIGTVTQINGNQQHDIVFFKALENQIQDYAWISCISGAAQKGKSDNTNKLSQVDNSLQYNNQMANSIDDKDFNVYPNPVSSAANISFTLDKESDVNVALYNINGSFVRTLINGKQGAGAHNITFEKQDIASGVFYIIMETNGQDKKAKKIVIQ